MIIVDSEVTATPKRSNQPKPTGSVVGFGVKAPG